MTELRFADYGQMKELNCTDEEMIIYDILRSVTGADDLECVRRTDKYVSAAIGETDVARFNDSTSLFISIFKPSVENLINSSDNPLASEPNINNIFWTGLNDFKYFLVFGNVAIRS